MWTTEEYKAAHAGATAAARDGKHLYLELCAENGAIVALIWVAEFQRSREHYVETPGIDVLWPGTIRRVRLCDVDNVWLEGPVGPETFTLTCCEFGFREQIMLGVGDLRDKTPKFSRLVADVAMIYLDE